MALEMSWFVVDHIIHQRFSGVVTLDDIAAVNSYLQDAQYHVHILMDVREVSQFPDNLFAINQVVARTDNQGWSLIVGNDPSVCLWAILVSQLRNMPCYRAASIPEALEFIKQKDVGLRHHRLLQMWGQET